MTKKEEVTEKVATNNRVSLVFKHPEILTEFNNNIIKQYGNITGNRIKVIETLLSNYNKHRNLEEKKPLYVEENRKLLEENNRLLTENKNYEIQVETLTQMTKKLKEYDTLKEENRKLQETVQNKSVTIDHMKEKLEDEENNRNDLLKLSEDLKTETGNRVQELKQILTGKEEEINKYASKIEDYTTVQEENIKLHETIKQKEVTIADYTKKINELQHHIATLEHTQEEDLKELNVLYEEVTESYNLKVNDYNTIQLENIKLTEELKNKSVTIDNCNSRVMDLQETVKELEHRLKELTIEHKEEVNEYKQELRSKDNDYKQASGYALKLHEEITVIKNLGFFSRVFKRYPEEDNRIRELKP